MHIEGSTTRWSAELQRQEEGEGTGLGPVTCTSNDTLWTLFLGINRGAYGRARLPKEKGDYPKFWTLGGDYTALIFLGWGGTGARLT